MLLVAGKVVSAQDFAAVMWMLKVFVWCDLGGGYFYFLSLKCHNLAVAGKTGLYRAQVEFVVLNTSQVLS